MRHAYAILLALLPWSFGVADDTVSESHARLDAAERLWNSMALRRHSYTLVSGGAFGHTRYRVIVRDGQCSAIAKPTPRSDWERVDCEGLTMADVFAEFRKQLAACPNAYVRIVFNERFGYIEELFFEPKTDISDQWWDLGVPHFRMWPGPRTETK
jgi:hypothetical protein